ncbi:Variant Ionotropic Glutamate Receptor [Penaeus vannamei]|uniref:Variant Ionotropic Glutamate Receptor n=1 Tax=Penaeus vannamei TaxID=6689 RepID=A0A3R7MGU1_PENVA|nr:Variant Ionotropic Glutamate Receptor [Penaeus vannamei]
MIPLASFHGAAVPVTVRPWMPNWMETQTATEGGANATVYSGTDYLALKTVAETLNFTVSQVEARDFVEIDRLVEGREVFLCPLIHSMLPERLERYDFTRWYTFLHRVFAMRTPAPTPPWASLVTPLSGEVWAAVVVATGLVALALRLMHCLGGDWYPTLGNGLLQLYKTLLGQDLAQRRLTATATRLVINAWLAFSLIVGVAYRTNLMAALILRSQPPRPETVEELVQAVDRINIPPYGKYWKDFYLSSPSSVYRAVGELLFVGPSIEEALELAAKENHAVISNRMFLDYAIASNFSSAASGPTLYTGKGSVDTVPAGWIVPQGAPYKRQLDRLLTAFVENGLFLKWHRDTMEEARVESLRRQKEERGAEETVGQGGGDRTLTLYHMQGPLCILGLGLGLAGLAFLAELVLGRWSAARPRRPSPPLLSSSPPPPLSSSPPSPIVFPSPLPYPSSPPPLSSSPLPPVLIAVSDS